MGTGGLFLRKLRARVADAPTGFVWVEDGLLAGSGYPASRSQVEWLIRSGIRSILTLTPEALPDESTRGLGLALGHVAMEDHKKPSLDAMNRAVDFIEGQIQAERPTVVHCLAGEGRTGCALAAYIIRSRGVGAEEALRVIRRAKPQFVEHAQETAIFEFASAAKR